MIQHDEPPLNMMIKNHCIIIWNILEHVGKTIDEPFRANIIKHPCLPISWTNSVTINHHEQSIKIIQQRQHDSHGKLVTYPELLQNLHSCIAEAPQHPELSLPWISTFWIVYLLTLSYLNYLKFTCRCAPTPPCRKRLEIRCFRPRGPPWPAARGGVMHPHCALVTCRGCRG